MKEEAVSTLLKERRQRTVRGALRLKVAPPGRKNPQAGVIHLLGKILREDYKFSFCL